ncbi:MAG TPA: pyridoxal phosphate-dependent aminotransferase [Polyangia bacterium]|nr:pyridoxal phosphate-dependent aminotransferase [Polyangia bacterium]
MRPPFSSRLPWDRPENALAALERARRAAGAPLIDLTVSNPTRVGLPDLGPRLREALGAVDVGAYEPTPAGARAARAAIAAALAEQTGHAVAPEHLLLTASSSESYAFLFKLLCDPGDAVLVPEPSYPLFEYLARLEGVTPVPYRLAYDGVWHVDFASVDDALDDARARDDLRPRALVVVNPNNPTGSFLKRAELPALRARCEAHGLAVIVDEVFAPYAARDDRAQVRALAAERAFTERVLTFALGGLSKACALPQLKLGWMTIAGPDALARDARARLELIADTYLSVGAPAQAAAARLLDLGRDARRAVAARIAANHAQLARALPPSSACTVLAREGGWSAIVRVPATRTDAAWAEALLADDGVLVHPGYFFDLRGGTFVVLSLLPATEDFAEGVRRLVARCDA